MKLRKMNCVREMFKTVEKIDDKMMIDYYTHNFK